MIAEEVMHRSPKCLTDKDTVLAAATLMRDENIGFIPICDEAGHVVGTLTDRDIVVRLVAEDGASSVALGWLMSRDPIVCRPEDELSTVERLMQDKHKSRIVCVNADGRPAGVISLSDIARVEDAERAGRTLRAITEREVRSH
jgi:CBS domain-containing protein